MRVFLSWSGQKSNQAAQILREWLPAVIQATRPYFSPDDTAKGARWSSEVAAALQESKVGILCITSENLSAPWLMFEAGALAKTLDRACVIPFLLDIEPSALAGPLSQFQAARCDRTDVLRLVKVVNDQLESSALEASVLDSVFTKWWPELESKLTSLRSQPASAHQSPSRPDRELLEELLSLVRDMTFTRAAARGRGALATVAEMHADPIESLQLTPRVEAALRSAGLVRVGDLLEKAETDLLMIAPIGRVAINEIKEVLASRGFTLTSSIPK